MQIEEAGALGIESLYNYQPYMREWLEQVVSDSKLYFSNPATFNDPWDFRPNFNVTVLDNPDTYTRHVQWFDYVDRKYNTHLSDAQYKKRTERAASDRNFLENMINNFSRSIPNATFERYRVYCVSTKADNALMWSHYAASHTGVCLEFDCRIRHFGAAIRVHYHKSYSVHDLSDNDLATVLLPWVAKSDAWSYEDEFRIISQESGTNPPPPSGVLVTRNGLLKIPPRALRSVIMGCSIPPDTEAHVRCLVAARASPPVVLKRAVRKRDRYELTIEGAS